MSLSNPIINVPTAALPRIVRFDTQFMQAFQGMRDPWYRPFTSQVNMDAGELLARFPVLTNRAEFKLFDGVPQFRALSNKFWDLSWDIYQDGVEAHIDKISAPTFHGWDEEPANMAQEAMDFRVLTAGQLLMTNPTTQVDAVSWFSHLHPCDFISPVSGEVNDNDMYSLSVSTTSLDSIDKRFMGFCGPKRRPLRMRLTNIISPTALFHSWDAILNPEAQNVNQGSTNRWRGRVGLTWAPEIDLMSDGTTANTTTYFAIAQVRNARVFAEARARAWNGDEIETRYFDQNSDRFKNSGMIAISKLIKHKIVPAEPVMAIIRCSTAAE
jgi:hypothetical protein